MIHYRPLMYSEYVEVCLYHIFWDDVNKFPELFRGRSYSEVVPITNNTGTWRSLCDCWHCCVVLLLCWRMRWKSKCNYLTAIASVERNGSIYVEHDELSIPISFLYIRAFCGVDIRSRMRFKIWSINANACITFCRPLLRYWCIHITTLLEIILHFPHFVPLAMYPEFS